MSRDRFDVTRRPLGAPIARPTEAGPVGKTPREGRADALPEPKGALFGAGARRARRVGEAVDQRPAQLQVRGPLKPLPTTDVAIGQSTPVAPLRRAFDQLAPRSVQADVRLLAQNTEAWLSMWSNLSGKTGDVDASYFIFQRDVFGMALLGQFLLRAQNGDRVRLMLDAAGDAFGKKGFTLTGRGQDYLQEVVGAGGQVKVYHPLHKKALTTLRGGSAEAFAGVANNHDKIMRTPDSVNTGGRNISKDYFTAPEDRADVYRDTDVVMHGRAVSREYERAFDREFEADDAHFVAYSDTFGNWVKRDLELIGAAAMMDLWLDGPPPSAAEKARLRTDAGYRKARAEGLLEATLKALPEYGVEREAGVWDRRNLRKLARELAGYAELAGARRSFDPQAGLLRGQEVKVVDRTSARVASADHLDTSLQRIADGSRVRLVLQNPYVVLTKDTLAVLEKTGKRGVDIELVTNSPDSSDSVLTQAFFLEDWPKILARVPNLRIFAFTGEQKLHAKVAAADGTVAKVGSDNLDLISEQINGEIAMTAWSPELTRQLVSSIDADKADPKHGVVEYTIQRDTEGRPVLKDGAPVVTYGPKDHMSTMNRAMYAALRWMVRQVRKLPALDSISGIDVKSSS